MKFPNPPATIEQAKKLGLLEEEFQKICEILGRTPNFTELAVYSVMWSEHCSYKNSIRWLKTLPREGPHLLAKAGEENAGLVDIGEGLACAFKIESHNHPSAIEPYQGAATGVGGINRDIFTMGARPIAQMNSLRFGKIKEEKTKWLIRGVVKGIGDYGNAFGVPTVGGEVFFDDSFTVNPLVNAMSVGIVETGKSVRSVAEGEGNPVFIVGSATGKDGLGGAAFASKDINENSMEDLPAVQVGDPFQEKLLLEATLEVIATGAVVGMQDMGAAGIACSTSEMSAKGKHGMDIWLDKVPARQPNMQPFEFLLSESQERMLVVVKKGREEEVKKIFEKWDLHIAQIGVVTKGNTLRYFYENELYAEIPADSLVLGGGAPVYEREYREPSYIREIEKFNQDEISEPSDLKKIMLHLASHPNICSKKWVYRQYDSMVGTINRSFNRPCSASVVNLKKSRKALAMSVDCNSRYVYSDPEKGCAIAVCEAARNISCAGGIPSAVTNCLNFGNPYNPEVYWQFVKSIRGMKLACEKFQTPVTGGNVSFYNQSSYEGPVFPTPTIGMIGILEDKNLQTTISFQKEGDLIYLLGKEVNDIACSEYVYSYLGIKHSPAPYFDLEEEYAVQKCIQKIIRSFPVQSVQDVSDGGLFIALLECASEHKTGFRICSNPGLRKDAFLFGEAQGRIVVSIAPEHQTSFEQIVKSCGVPFREIGIVSGKEIIIDDESYGEVEEMLNVYHLSLEKELE
jgi:phosphoribosylformylglycinamidine synthase